MPHRNGHVIYRRASKTDPLSLKPPVCPFLEVWPRRSDRLAFVLDNLRPDDIIPVLEEEQLQNAGFDPPAALKACREVFFLVSEDMSVNRRAKLTPYRRPILTPLYVSRAGPEPTELIML